MKKHHKYSISTGFNLALILLLLAAGNIYGANTQKSYNIRDEIYRRVSVLCIASGTIPPSVSPLSGEMLLDYLDRIDEKGLSATMKSELQSLYREIEKHDGIYRDSIVELSLGLDINLDLYFADYRTFDFSHRLDNSFMKDRRNESINPFRLSRALFEGEAGIYFSRYIALEGSVMVGNNNHHMYESSLGWLINHYDGDAMSLFSYKEGDVNGYPMDFPYKAGISVGGSFVSFILGRYPHSYGPGRNGGLTIGDNFKYQEIAQISLFSPVISYYMSLTRFDLMLNEEYRDIVSFSRNKFSGNQQYRIVHRLEGVLFDRLRLAIDFGTLYSTDNGFDLRFFQPFMIQHNYGNYTNFQDKEYFDEANNILSFSLDAALGRGFLLSFEFLLDQLQTATEVKDSVPPSYGILASVSYAHPFKKGLMETYIEFVYTNPYLYLNGKRDEAGVLDYNLDYIVGYHSAYVDEYGYSGYIYGPDTISLCTGASFDSFDNSFSIDGSILYRIQGTNTIRHLSTGYHETHIDMTHASFDKDYAEYTPSCSLDIAEHMLEAKTIGNIYLPYGFSILLGVQINLYWNFENNPDLDWVVRPQGRAGLTWRI